jgi:ribosome maturation factor RimP
MMRVFIDRPGGVDVDHCAEVSNHLTRLFAVEGIEYDRLEVSSPGLDRPLHSEADYRRFVGRAASLVLEAPLNGQTFFSGRIGGVEDGQVVLLVGKRNRAHRIPIAGIKRARLEVEF